jgi:polysaccharide biosynthesis protein PslG
VIPSRLLRRIQLTALALIATLLALAWTTVQGGASSGAVGAPRPAREIPFSDVHPYGANFFLEREADTWTQRKTVELAAEAGLRWAKQQFLWSEIERQPGVYDWSKYDRIVDLYRSHGLEVIARLDWSPAWVRGDYQPGLNNPPDNVADFARFVGEVVKHFRGRVRFYQLWNEPNLLAEWGNRLDHPVSPAEYVGLLAPASKAARAADPNVVILTAPLAINAETVQQAGNMSDLTYLDGMYKAGAAPYFDILAANAFGMDRSPDEAPGPDRLNFRRVELQRQIMARNGDGGKAIWFNEYGWNAAPATLGASRLIWGRVSEDQQAAWTTEGVAWARDHWPWSGVFNIWYFRQWGGKTPAEADYYFRMVDPDFTPRRVYQAVTNASQSLEVAGPGEWSERSSPVTLTSLDDWDWVWDEGAADRNTLIARRPGAALSFRFQGPAVAVRAESGPAAGNLIAEIDGRRVSGSTGVVPLAATAQEWRWLPVADGLANQAHELRLSAGDGGRVAIDGFRVTTASGRQTLSPVQRLLGAAAFGLILLLVVDSRRALSRVRV